MWDVFQEHVKYVHNAENQAREALNTDSESDSFTFTLRDGAGGVLTDKIISFVINPINQAPKVAVQPNDDAGLPNERMDHSWRTNPETNEPELIYTVWGYEGEQGIPFSFEVTDKDQALDADFTVSFTALPNESQGFFWYNDGAGWVKIISSNMASTSLSLDRIQDGNLVFCHSGIENGGPVQFQISATDDGGGQGVSSTVTESFQINIRPNNDHPEWSSIAANYWADAAHTVDGVDGDWEIALSNGLLNGNLSVTDKSNESATNSLTYTIQSYGSNGLLLYKTLSASNETVYSIIKQGDKITQADIDSGKIVWRFHEAGDPTVDITFIVRDSCLTSIPIPKDGEAVDYNDLVNGTHTSSTGWENAWAEGLGLHEGGIGKWVESNGSYVWELTTHTLTIQAHNLEGGETPVIEYTNDPVPAFALQGMQTLFEGQWKQFTKAMLDAWFYEKGSSSSDRVTGEPGYPSAVTDNLVYRVEMSPVNGWLLRCTSGTMDSVNLLNNTWEVIPLGGSFTDRKSTRLNSSH